jgi:hypothetical protein
LYGAIIPQRNHFLRYTHVVSSGSPIPLMNQVLHSALHWPPILTVALLQGLRDCEKTQGCNDPPQSPRLSPHCPVPMRGTLLRVVCRIVGCYDPPQSPPSPLRQAIHTHRSIVPPHWSCFDLVFMALILLPALINGKDDLPPLLMHHAHIGPAQLPRVLFTCPSIPSHLLYCSLYQWSTRLAIQQNHIDRGWLV